MELRQKITQHLNLCHPEWLENTAIPLCLEDGETEIHPEGNFWRKVNDNSTRYEYKKSVWPEPRSI